MRSKGSRNAVVYATEVFFMRFSRRQKRVDAQKKTELETPHGGRTRNLPLRRRTPYPIGPTGLVSDMKKDQILAMSSNSLK